MTDEPRIILVNGLPGAGKTTVAAELARRFERAVVIEGDHLQHGMTVTGLVGPGDEPADEAELQLNLRWDNIRDLARNCYDAGFTVVIDSLATPVLLGRFTGALAPRRLAHVMLEPDRAVGLARDAARTTKTIGDRYDWVAADLERARGLGVWIDSTHQTVTETVDAAEAAVRSGAASTWHRSTGRVIPTDGQGRVLLVEGFAQGRPEEPFWFTIGGAADPGETVRAAAARELREECGVEVDESRLGEPYLEETVEFENSGFTLVQAQAFYTVRLDPDVALDLSGMDEFERDTTLQVAWLPAADLATGRGMGNPRMSTPRLPEICRLAVLNAADASPASG